MNITPRLLETMIRLSTANAKLRLSELVEESDANEIISLINESITKKVLRKRTVKKVQAEQAGISLGQELRNAAKDDILEGIWKWRDSNQDKHHVDVKTLSEYLDMRYNDVEAVIEELAAQDIIMNDDGKIYFLD